MTFDHDRLAAGCELAAGTAAHAELAAACEGWRRHHRCIDPDGGQRRDPHAHCLAAQRRYVRALLESGAA